MTSLDQTLCIALEENKIVISDKVKEQLVSYLQLIKTWNRVYNLTRITEWHDMIYLHIIDSLTVRFYLQGIQCLDVGSGAGLPGVPLAIVHPHQQWTLLDKNSKKTRFLTQVVAELGLTHVKVVHTRCEDFHPKQCFDTILSRALGTVSLFVELTKHLLCEDGILIAMKGKYPKSELNDIPNDFMIKQVVALDTKGVDIERHLICLKRKIHPC